MKLNKYHNKILAIYESLDELIGVLEDKQNDIEDNAIEHDRDMTEREQERWDLIDNCLYSVNNCLSYLQSAMEEITEFCDFE